MTNEEYSKRWPFAIDRLRHVCLAFGGVNESFNQKFTVEGLLALHKAWMLSEWDISPDRWTTEQVQAALLGTPPRWDDNGSPL